MRRMAPAGRPKGTRHWTPEGYKRYLQTLVDMRSISDPQMRESEAANGLGISVRTLQDYLHRDGTTWADLVKTLYDGY